MDKLRLLKVAALLLLIFLGGGVAGILLDRHFARRTPVAQRVPPVPPPDRPDVLLREFTTAMKLTPEQQERVGVLLRGWNKTIVSHPEWTRAQRASLVESNSPLLRTNLTAEQAVIFDRLLERMRRRNSR